MPVRKAKYSLCEVTWNDAQDLGGRQSWMTIEEIKLIVEKEEVIVKSVGWLLGKCNNQVVLASSFSPGSKEGEQDDYGTIQLIPSKWVKKIRYL